MKDLSLIIGLTTLLSLLLSSSCSELIVRINEGLIKGRYVASKEGKVFAAFTGIPYAEPPLGSLRFKVPVPKKPWDQVKDATKPHSMCPQRDIYRRTDQIEGEEDCLFLNVYTPKLNYKTEMKLLPVMLYIHGGGFFSDSALSYTPETMMDREVVLVTINYRLGALGFLTTGDMECPGNNGLKDQNLAIKWTKENIRIFGGDPEKITLFGQSAGGASVNFHILSPLSQNLFQAGISESGSASCPWAVAPKDEGVLHGKKLARIFNCPTEKSKDMVKCLRTVKPLDFIAQDTKFMKWDTDPMIPFKPCIEPMHNGAFLTAHPLDIIKSGKVPRKPWMTGVNAQDGAIRSASIIANAYLWGDLNDEFDRLAPISLLYDKLGKNVSYITNKIRKFYFGNGPITKDSKSGITNMYTDHWLMSCADQMIRYYLKYVKTPVYYYLFGYRGTTSMSAIYGDPNNDYGVCHADELQYLFPLPDKFFPEKMQQRNDLKMAEVLTTLWVNFAKTGKPTPKLDVLTPVEWKPVQTEDMEYYFIGGPTQLNMTKGLYVNRTRFWREILDNDFNRSGKDKL